MGKTFKIMGMGAALVDVFANVTEDELSNIGSPKASMSLISPDEAIALEAQIQTHTRASGGSAGNTVAGIAALGLKTGFIGKVGDDELGAFFSEDMRRLATHFPMAPHADQPTGRCLVLITPDAERTMHTLLGASVATETSDLDTAALADTEILFGEGYIWDSASARETFLEAARIVKENGGRVAFSLSDPFCVERHHADLQSFVNQHVDILLSNLAEAQALFGTSEPLGIVTACRAANIEGAITRGAEGAIIVTQNEAIEISAEHVEKIIDLTGAGDQFAAGYLSGRAEGLSIARSGRRGAIAAAEVIAHVGPRPKEDIAALFMKAGV